jgi:Xaa-Pro aminopeptidase
LDNAFIIAHLDKKPILYKGPLEQYTNAEFEIITSTEFPSQFKNKKIAADFKYVTLALQEESQGTFVDVSKALSQIRTKKTADELQKIKIACEHTVKCFNLLISFLKTKKYSSLTEMDIVRFIKTYALDHDLELAFPPIIASGKDASIPHHIPSTKLQDGFCIIDFGFEYKGYKSDMTRTVYFGEISETQRKIYECMLKVQMDCIHQVKAGVLVKTLHDYAQQQLGPNFTHALGHGIGVQIHESPRISNKSDEVLAQDMLITIEPGVYVSNVYGIRIEDTVLVTELGCEILTPATKELIVVKSF